MAKITKKQAAIKWQELLTSIRNSTPANISESIEDQVKRKKWLEEEGNHEEWFKYYFPKYCQRKDGTFIDPMPFHIEASKRVIENLEYYDVRMWSRELAKSTRTMEETFYLCFVKWKRNVILTSCNEKQAEKLLRPLKANLEANQRIIQDYGEQEKIGQWEKSEFVTKTGISFTGVGLGGNPRGSKNEEIRPDILLFDDCDTDQDCRNPTMVKNNWKWIDEAVLGTRSISEPTTVIFCGNRIAKYCCMTEAAKFADHVDIINIRDANGISSWPQKNSEAQIDRVLAQRSYAAQQKEYYNNPIVEGSVFKEMAYKKALPLGFYSHLVCYTDPSFKDTNKNDYKATVLIGKWRDEFHVIKAFVEQTTTAKMIEWHYEIMNIVGVRSCYYYMEEVFLQELIINEFYKTSRITGRVIPIMGDKRAKDDKFTRIESLLEPLHRNGKLYLNEDERDNPHMKKLDEQFIAFAPGSRAHDDGPDAVEGGVWMLNAKSITFTGNDVIMQGKQKGKNHY